ncbi:MAG TPA: ABC transporter ATP-binding protein [Acidimicrobiales bacterium]|nr:ABC transporter ATP-binding protein [Acidimicrobiales bacterium]
MGADDARPASVLRRALRAQRPTVLLAAALVTLHQTAEVLVPLTIGVIIDRGIAPGDSGQTVRWLLVLAGQFVVLSASGCTGVYVDERARMGATHTARTELAARVLDARGGVERALPGEVVSLSTVETTRIGDGVGAVIMAIGAVAGVVVGAVILFVISVWLGLVVVVGLPLVLLVVQVLAEPLVARASAHQDAVGVASGVAADLFRGLRVLKGLGADWPASARYRSASRSALRAGLDANRARSTYAGFTVTIASVFVVLVTWLGARQALDGRIGIGALVTALGVTSFLVGPLGRLALAGSEIAQARASSAHLDAALGAPFAVVDGPAVVPGDGGVPALAIVGLEHRTLAGVSLSVGPGELVGVVADPVDLAALVECLDRSSDPAGGQILLDDVVHAALGLDDARRLVVVAHHDAPLFGDSIGANVSSARAMAAACLDDVLAVVPGGIDGVLTEEGRSLSGGQRQRVALARALATEAPVLVLHEPTTAVDTATEQRIASGVRALRAGRTTLLLTSSPTLLACADRVVLVAAGQVVASGSHATLALTEARYRAAVLG